MPNQKLVMRIEPRLDAVPELLDRLEAYSESMAVPPETVYRLAVVCEELVSNVATHGARGEPVATFVEVAVHRDVDCLHLSVQDDGRPFDPLAQPVPDTTLELEDRKVGGLGIHFARRLVREISYRRSSGRNHVTAVFDTKAAGSSGIDSE